MGWTCADSPTAYSLPGIPGTTFAPQPLTGLQSITVTIGATREPVRINSLSFVMGCTPTNPCTPGVFRVQFLQTSEMVPYQSGLIPFVFNGPLQQSSTITFDLTPYNGFEMGVGWTGTVLITTDSAMSTAFPFSPTLVTDTPTGNCFTPSISSNWNITFVTQRGGPLSYTTSMSGTSSSAALIAGAAAVVRQYYTAGYYPTGAPVAANVFTPSAALMKATLINSATPLAARAFGQFFGPSANAPDSNTFNGQGGFGVPSLPRGLTLPGSAQRLVVFGLTPAPAPQGRFDPTLSFPGTYANYCVDVASRAAGPATPLIFTLVWSDLAALTQASSELVLNLDLSVVPPGFTYAIQGNTVNVTSPFQQPDIENNVEQIVIPAPAATLDGSGGRIAAAYTIRVRLASNPDLSRAPNVRYSLVAAGPGITGFTGSPAGCPVAPPPAPAADASAVPLSTFVATTTSLTVILFVVLAGLGAFFFARKQFDTGVSFISNQLRGAAGCPAFSRGYMREMCAQPAHVLSYWPALLVLCGAMNFALFANLGLAGNDQIFLINGYGQTAADTVWPAQATAITAFFSVPIALITDRYDFFGYGKRLPYIILGQLVASVSYFAIAWTAPTPNSGAWINYIMMTLVRGLALNLAGAAFGGWIVDNDVRPRIGHVQLSRAVGTMLGLAVVIQAGPRMIEDNFGTCRPRTAAQVTAGVPRETTCPPGFLPYYALLVAVAVAPFIVLPLTLYRCVREVKKESAEKGAAVAPYRGQCVRLYAFAQCLIGKDLSALGVLGTRRGIAIMVLTATGAVGNVAGNFLINIFLQNIKGLTQGDVANLGTVSFIVNLPGSILAAYACVWGGARSTAT